MKLATLLFLFVLGITSCALAQPAIPPAYGTNSNLPAKTYAAGKSFGRNDRIAGTYYFYWYDVSTKSHVIDGDGTDALTTHPPTLEDFSYKSVAWHKKQLRDMMAAGIDVLLPVFWGAPSEQKGTAQLHWSYAGLPPLVQAREELVREGKQPPFIGLFYDTSTLQYNQWGQHIDLTTDYGRRWFYATVRDFFSSIPPRHWAMIEGQPIVLLYSAAFAKKHDQSVFDFTREQFARDFGGRVPWIAREISWQVKADSTVAWGGALGLKNPGIASLGPGYDHSAVPGRTPLIVDREGGKFYERNWLKFLRRPSNFVMLETWNEWHEGTDIAESKEYGRLYLDLTRKYVDLFKSGAQVPWPKGPFTGAKSVSINLGPKNQENGLRQIESGDGQTEPATVGDRTARRLKTAPANNRYMYFQVDDSFKWAAEMNLKLELTYYDAKPGNIWLDFDSNDETALFAGAYTRSSATVKMTGSETWKTAVFPLPNARLLNSQNSAADFRLATDTAELLVGKLTLIRE